MTVKELVDIYENIYNLSVRDIYSANVMYCKIIYNKHGDYNLEDIENYCKFVYLFKESEKLKNELIKLTSYGKNPNLISVLDKVTSIYKNSVMEVDRLAAAINCYDHEEEPIKDGIEDLFEMEWVWIT